MLTDLRVRGVCTQPDRCYRALSRCIDTAEGDLEDEFSVLVSLEEFMKELGERCGRTDAGSNGIYDLLEQMHMRAPVWVF